jgi:hypothetical protein
VGSTKRSKRAIHRGKKESKKIIKKATVIMATMKPFGVGSKVPRKMGRKGNTTTLISNSLLFFGGIQGHTKILYGWE